jgi:hypothetical protein
MTKVADDADQMNSIRDLLVCCSFICDLDHSKWHVDEAGHRWKLYFCYHNRAMSGWG